MDTSGVGSVVLGTVESLHRVLDELAGDPVTPLKTGGFGQREVQRVARACRLPAERARLLLEVAVRGGLLGPDTDDRFRPTGTSRWWRSLEPPVQWASLVTAWWRSTGLRAEAPPPQFLERLATPALASLAAADAGALRHALVDVLAELPPSHAIGDGLGTAIAWRAPAAADAASRASSVLAEAEALGVTAAGALTPVGRAVLPRSGRPGDSVQAAADALLPAATSSVALQSDLTAVASGPVAAATAAVLDAAADREGAGVWRFSRTSVRRGAGRRADR